MADTDHIAVSWTSNNPLPSRPRWRKRAQVPRRLASTNSGRRWAATTSVEHTFGAQPAVRSPFDLDVRAGHAVFHFLLAFGVAPTLALLCRRLGSRLARWSTAALAVAQLVEAIAADFDPEGSAAADAIPNAAGVAVLQPLVLVSLHALIASDVIHRRGAGE